MRAILLRHKLMEILWVKYCQVYLWSVGIIYGDLNFLIGMKMEK